jgi:hypothetical protein
VKLDAKLNTTGEVESNGRRVIAVSVRLVEYAGIPSGKLVVPVERIPLIDFK